jgi:MoaA/NifB/PqqE/SkfB family radical SAM enzyme
MENRQAQPLSTAAGAERKLHDRHMDTANFDLAPFTIAWEVTRACAFACVHCRADAQHTPDPRELTTQEAFRCQPRSQRAASLAW